MNTIQTVCFCPLIPKKVGKYILFSFMVNVLFAFSSDILEFVQLKEPKC